jgi:hypothetical protein
MSTYAETEQEGTPISLQAQVWVNAVATNLTCTVDATQAIAPGLTFTCQDTVDAVSVNAGDMVTATMTATTTGGVGVSSMIVSLEKQ